MRTKKWLWAAAVLVMAGVCGACKGGDGGSKSLAAAEENQEPGGRVQDEETEESEKPADDTVRFGDGEENRGESPDAASGGETRTGDKTESKDADGQSKNEDGGGFATGTWDGLTFKNPWLGVSIPFPEGSKVFSEEEMRKLVGTSDEILVNSGDYEDIGEKASRALNIYDLMVTLPDGRSSVQLAYMNARMADPTREITAAECLEEMAGELSAIGDMGYEVSPIEKKEIGGRVFDGFSASLMGGALYQEYYGIRAGDYVAILTASYEESGKEAVAAVIGGIE